MIESESRLFQIQRLEEEGKSVCGIKKREAEKLEREIEDRVDEEEVEKKLDLT